MYCPPNQRRPQNRPQSDGDTYYEFYATFTDGRRETVRGMTTMEKSHVPAMAKQIARRADVQCVQPVQVRR